MRIETPRLALVAGTADLVRAQLDDPERWQQLLGARAPEGWPPEFTEDVWQPTWQWLANDPGSVGWSMWYFVRKDAADPVIVGTGGFKGRPDAEGTVETGYSIVQSYQRQGYATEAVDGLVAWAFRQEGVRRVIAHTYPHLTASIGVLGKLGFTLTEGAAEPGTVRYELVARR